MTVRYHVLATDYDGTLAHGGAVTRRHTRKYAEGQLSPERSFYFRGPQKKLKLRAQNLIQFLELAEGVDEETWAYHFANGDYSRWFRDGIKDADLASEAQHLESSHSPDRADSLAPLRDAIDCRYTLPAAPAGARARRRMTQCGTARASGRYCKP